MFVLLLLLRQDFETDVFFNICKLKFHEHFEDEVCYILKMFFCKRWKPLGLSAQAISNAMEDKKMITGQICLKKK